jgi:2'-5' RNA ligase
LEAQETLSALALDLSRRWPRISWAKSGAYHITLAFLGEVDAAGVESATEAVAALDAPAFVFRFAGIGGFPPRPPWRVLYVRMDDGSTGPAERIYRSLNEALVASARRHGLRPLNPEWRAEGGARAFVPHITLARMPDRRRGGKIGGNARKRGAEEEPRPLDIERMAANIESALAGQWTIDRCSLYKSELRPEGALYTELEGRVLRRCSDPLSASEDKHRREESS